MGHESHRGERKPPLPSDSTVQIIIFAIVGLSQFTHFFFECGVMMTGRVK